MVSSPSSNTCEEEGKRTVASKKCDRWGLPRIGGPGQREPLRMSEFFSFEHVRYVYRFPLLYALHVFLENGT